MSLTDPYPPERKTFGVSPNDACAMIVNALETGDNNRERKEKD